MQFNSVQDTDTLELEIQEGDEADTVEVLLSSWLPNVAGVEAEIEYDSDVVEFVAVDSVDLGGIVDANDDDGSLFLSHAAAKSDSVDEPTTTKLTFKIVGDGDMSFEVVDDETTVFEVVEIDGETQLAENAVETMSLDTSTDELGDEDTDGDGSDGDSESDAGDGESGDGETERSDTDANDNDAEGDSANDGDGTDASDGATDEDDSAANSEDASNGDAAEANGESELVSGVGLLAVVAGFLFAVAILARDQM